MDREIVEMAVYSAGLFVAVPTVIRWTLRVRLMQRPRPRSVWPITAGAFAAFVCLVALLLRASVLEQAPELAPGISNYTRPIVGATVIGWVLITAWLMEVTK